MLLITCWLLSILSGQMCSLSWCSALLIAITFLKVIINLFVFVLLKYIDVFFELTCLQSFFQMFCLEVILSHSPRGLVTLGGDMSWFFMFFFLHWDLDIWSFLIWAFDFVLFWGLFCFCCCSSIFLLSVAVFMMFRRSSNSRVVVLFSSVGPAFRATGPDLVSPRESATVCNDSYQCQPCFHCSWWPPWDWMPYPRSGQLALCFCCFDLKL